MIIANPIYDVVFKRLMEHKPTAKFFIETLLEEEIVDIQVKPQEFTYKDEASRIAIFRLDFIATIKTKIQGYKKVLIEVQKARQPFDLVRFRSYLGSQYQVNDEINTSDGIKDEVLPIISIYLIGFNLPEIESSVVKVSRNYMDLLTHRVLDVKSDFIERLTHDCYVVQLLRIHGKMHTRLEKLLGVFEQNYFVDRNGIVKEYNESIDDEEIKSIIDLLHYMGTEPLEKKKIENEQEGKRIIALYLEEATQKFVKEMQEKEREIQEKEREIQEKEKEMQEKEKEMQEKNRLIEELKRRLGENK